MARSNWLWPWNYECDAELVVKELGPALPSKEELEMQILEQKAKRKARVQEIQHELDQIDLKITQLKSQIKTTKEK